MNVVWFIGGSMSSLTSDLIVDTQEGPRGASCFILFALDGMPMLQIQKQKTCSHNSFL